MAVQGGQNWGWKGKKELVRSWPWVWFRGVKLSLIEDHQNFGDCCYVSLLPFLHTLTPKFELPANCAHCIWGGRRTSIDCLPKEGRKTQKICQKWQDKHQTDYPDSEWTSRHVTTKTVLNMEVPSGSVLDQIRPMNMVRFILFSPHELQIRHIVRHICIALRCHFSLRWVTYWTFEEYLTNDTMTSICRFSKTGILQAFAREFF